MVEATDKTATSTRRRPGRPRNSETGATSTPSRRRRRRATGDEILAELDRMITQLIKENRQLQRQIAKLSARSNGATSGSAGRVLRSLERKVSRVVSGPATSTRRRRSTAAAAVSKPRRKITDPEVLAKRRDALAKARAVRAEKRSAGSA